MFDLVLGIPGIVFSLPLWILIALAIWLEDGFPIFYIQDRVGYRNVLFKNIKFRSMIKNAEKKTGPVLSSKDDRRITNAGRFLRATALDELPQLINIIKNEMSFVGPRPERPTFVEEFREQIPNYDLRHSVKPGLTGMAQVYGKYDSAPSEKFKYDMFYIDHRNIILDVKLITASFIITFRCEWMRMDKEHFRFL